MNLKVKAFVANLLSFAIFFIIFRFLITKYTALSGLWVPFVAFFAANIIAPKFQSVSTKEGDKLFVKWLFFKDIKEIK